MSTLPGHRLRNRLAHESGSSSAAYAGIIVVVVMLVLVLIVASPQWGQVLTCKIGSELSKIGGGGGYSCEVEAELKDTSHVPTQACVNASSKTSLSASESATFVVTASVEANGSIHVEKMSDGTYRVTDSRGGSVQVEEGAGVGARVVADGKSYGVYANASAGAGITGNGGVTYTLSSEQEKDDLVSYLNRHAVGDAVSAAGGLVGNIGDKVFNGVWDAVDGYEPPSPSEVYTEGGAIVSGGAGAADVMLSASAEAKGTVVLGARTNTDTKAVTRYYKVEASAEAGASDGLAAEGSASAQGSVTIAVTTGADGNVTNVTATGMYYVGAGGSVKAGPFGDTIEAGSADVGRRYQASVDLTSQETKNTAQELMNWAGIPVPGQGGSLSYAGQAVVSNAAEAFVEAARDHGTLTRQDVDVSGHEYGADAEIDARIGLSVGGSYSTEDIAYSNGQYWDGSEWQDWEGC